MCVRYGDIFPNPTVNTILLFIRSGYRDRNHSVVVIDHKLSLIINARTFKLRLAEYTFV